MAERFLSAAEDREFHENYLTDNALADQIYQLIQDGSFSSLQYAETLIHSYLYGSGHRPSV